MAGASADNKTLEDFYILPPFSSTREVALSAGHKWLQSGIRLSSLDCFYDEVRSFTAGREKMLYVEKRTRKHYFSDDAIARMRMAQRLRWERVKGTTE